MAKADSDLTVTASLIDRLIDRDPPADALARAGDERALAFEAAAHQEACSIGRSP